MDQQTLLTIAETALRIGFGLRFLTSGISNIRRWPNPVRNAELVFPFGTKFFGVVAVFLMVGGAAGLILGLATRIAALMIALFLLPTIKIQLHWLKALPPIIEEVSGAVTEAARPKLQLLARHAYHSHETTLQENILFVLLALYFAARGAGAFALDNLF
ncbi:MAG TPA: DoxX family protein [Candidatus Binatia bacterium]